MILFNIRRVLQKKIFFVSLRLRSRGEDPSNYIVKKGVTDICIDGYPRSANSFSVRMFRQANPDSKIAHHTHSIANIEKAIECNIPVVVLIRNPEQAIVSSVIAHEKNNVDEEICRYIDFYDWVYRRMDKIVLADFDKVINDFNSVIVDINKCFSTSFFMLDDVKKADSQVKGDIENRYDQLGQEKMQHIKPIPSNERDSSKEKFRDKVLLHHGFLEAKKIYKSIMLNAKK